MTILCIETSTSVCSAAICKDGAPLKQCICHEGSNHAGLDVPLIPVPTLDILVENFKIHNSPITNAILLPMIDARRMEVYTEVPSDQVQSDKGDRVNRAKAVVVESEDSIWSPSLEERDGERLPVFYFGDGAAKCQSVLTSPNWHFVPGIVPEAQYMGALAENRQPSAISHQQLAYYEPYYLKEFVAAQSHVKGLKS